MSAFTQSPIETAGEITGETCVPVGFAGGAGFDTGVLVL
jgi:hypothetical protein